MKTTRFRSWIPSVTARLSFSEIGDTSHPSRCVRRNVGLGDKRLIVCYQARDLSDKPFPSLRRIFSQLRLCVDERMWFTLVAEAGYSKGIPLESLWGQVAIFTDKKVWRTQIENEVKDTQSVLNDYRATKNDTNVKYKAKEYIRKLKRHLHPNADFVVYFRLYRNGHIKIWSDSDIPLKEGAPKFDVQNGISDIRPVASQAYYFFKDVSHHHNHHDPRTDTVVDLYLENCQPSTYQREVLYSLYRKAIQYKRHPNEANLFDSAGILAYAKSFKGTCETPGSWAYDENLPFYDYESSKASIESSQAKRNWIVQSSQSKTEKVTSVIFAVVGIVLSYLGLLSLSGYEYKGEVSTFLPKALELLLKNPTQAFGFLIIFIFILSNLFGIINPSKWEIFQFIYRVFANFSKLKSFLLIFGFGIAALLVSISWMFFNNTDFLDFLELWFMDPD